MYPDHRVVSAPSPRRRRVLFVAEAATLAHVGRPLALARALDRRLYEVHLACDPLHRRLAGDLDATWHNIHSQPSTRFAEALARGKPIFDTRTLRAYVAEDLRLLDRVAPELVVGDLRLSLSVSARCAGVRYANLSNACWSPYARPVFRVPELPLTRNLGPRLAQRLFDRVRGPVFAAHALPLNRVRIERGLAPLGLDLLQVYSDGDETLYADLPAVAPTFGLPSHHRYIGPVLWSPPVALPPWWDELPRDRPLVYATMGSSGNAKLLPRILAALASLPVVVAVATAGHELSGSLPANAWITDYLPGETVASRASLMICNGGTPSAYQAIAAGVPVLGLPTNLDQYLSMGYLEEAGVGQLLRSGDATPTNIRSAADRLLESTATRRAVHALQHSLGHWDARQRFTRFVQEVLPPALTAPEVASTAPLRDTSRSVGRGVGFSRAMRSTA